jgi:hypothetical protein
VTDLHVAVKRRIGAPAEQVCRLIADFRAHHPHFLPPAFSDFQVEQGGIGAGTVHRFKLTAGGRTRAYRMRVEEPEPGRGLTESDQLSSVVTALRSSQRAGLPRADRDPLAGRCRRRRGS